MIRNRTRLALAFIALLATYGCANSNQEQQKKIKIGVSVPAADHGWTAGVGYWAQTEINRYPDVQFIYTTANEPGKQTSDIEDMMTQQINGLVLLATEPNAMAAVAKKTKDRGIFLVSVDRGSETLTPLADVFLEGDNKAFGRKSAEYMVERLKGKGKIVILRGKSSSVDTDRYESAMQVFNANKGIQVLSAQTG